MENWDVKKANIFCYDVNAIRGDEKNVILTRRTCQNGRNMEMPGRFDKRTVKMACYGSLRAHLICGKEPGS
ncbi:MAG: hypothetical protein AMJ92_13130 [candidate division Zixibacteria bacterium SM23_81]|nr:MAG: hypothetical protein AMJ92_13130 [candidate division Zixibacteria bacterium SM23_81]